MTDHAQLGPDVRSFLDQLAAYGFPAWGDLDEQSGAAYLGAARAAIGAAASPGPDVAGVVSEDRVIGRDLPVRVYRRPGQAADSPAAVYLHGGGWVLGGLDQNDGWCRWFVQSSGMAMVSVDYRLAPEHPFPVPLDDCYEATRWVIEHAGELGCDPARVAVLGSSAGANLAAAVAIRARDAGLGLACQALVYPVLDSSCSTASYLQYARGYFLERDQMLWYWAQYTPDEASRSSPLAAPALASDLSRLPYTIVLTAECDPLRDEGQEYARRLAGAGVRVEYRCYRGQLHGFVVNRAAFEQADVATAELVALLRAGLDAPR